MRNRHNNQLYFRLAVPVHLRQQVGSTEIRRSLGTTDLRLGKRHASALAFRINEAFQAMAQKDDTTVRHLVSAFFANGGLKVEVQEPYTEKELTDAVRLAKELGYANPAGSVPQSPAVQKSYDECVVAYMAVRPTISPKSHNQ